MGSTVTINGVELTRYVQATLKVKAGGTVVWVDPHKVTAKEVGADKADIILVTHPHGDHMDPDAINAVKKPTTTLVTNPNVGAQLKVDVKTVQIKEGESTRVGGCSVKAVPGYNSSHNRAEGFNTGFVFTIGDKTLYHGGDTGKVPEMAQMGPIDIAMVPIGGTYTMDEAEAAEAVTKMIKPKVAAIPIHYGYATGGDPNKFKALVGSGIRVEILDPVLDIKYKW